MNKIVALITGGASGLGKATVNHLIHRGAIGCYIYDTQKVNSDHQNVLSSQGCVTDEIKLEDAFEKCFNKFGKVNLVVNCAGISIAFRIFNTNNKKMHKLEEFKKVTDVNILGTFNVNRLAAKYLDRNEIENEERGQIINVSSLAATDGQVGQLAISASSGAINSMILPLARDLQYRKIRANVIQPGFFHTPLIDFLPENVKEYLENCCLQPQRLGEPEEFANLVEMLVLNRYINAEIIRLDAGLRCPP